MASECFLALPSVSNSRETGAVFSLNHLSLLTSVESTSCDEYGELNLDTLSVTDDAMSAPTVVNNGTPGPNFESTVNEPVQLRTTSKTGRNSRGKNTKKASHEGSYINLQGVVSLPSQI